MQMGDRLVFRILAAPRRWDIVLYRPPSNPQPFAPDTDSLFTHRLVGLPGETIHLRDGAIWINGELLTPPTELEGLRWDLDERSFGADFACREPLTLANNECFVLGDNSLGSYDSRYFGPVPVDDVHGIAAFVYFPPRAWKLFSRH
jgi:signal peptidase I